MAVVIDQFEIVRDERPEPARGRAGETERPPAGPPPLSPRDIDDTIAHLARRALRLRAC